MIKELVCNSEDVRTYEIYDSDNKLVSYKQVDIVFKNKVFNRVKFSFEGIWTRENWKVLGSIASEISRLEMEEYAN
jgi:hypothetical protein